MPKVFISYRHVQPDEAIADQCADTFGRAGFDVFVDKRITVGRKWVDEITRHLQSSDHFVVLLSAESVQSDMVRQEVADAYRLARAGKLQIYPLRVNFEGALPYDLASYLDPIQYALWREGEPRDIVVDKVLEAIRAPQQPQDEVRGIAITPVDGRHSPRTGRPASAPLPAADPRLDTGAVETDSPFYVERPADGEVAHLVSGPGRTVLIKGARQVGKTSLLTRAMGAAERTGSRVVYIDCQLIDPAHLESLKALARYLAHRTQRTLRTSVMPDEVWDDYLGAPESLTDFLEQATLAEGKPITLCLDEVDRVFDYEYRNAFFAMVRAWHNRRATNGKWRPFGLLISHSTEPALFIDDINQSPFNVGEVFRLGDFEESAISWLNQRYGQPLASQGEVAAVHQLVGGHPYLVRQTLYLLAMKRVTSLPELVAGASEEDGPYGDHLRRHLFGLGKRARVAAAFKHIVNGQGCDDEVDFQRLKAAGLVEGATRDAARVRCDLYRRYFSRHL